MVVKNLWLDHYVCYYFDINIFEIIGGDKYKFGVTRAIDNSLNLKILSNKQEESLLNLMSIPERIYHSVEDKINDKT